MYAGEKHTNSLVSRQKWKSAEDANEMKESGATEGDGNLHGQRYDAEKSCWSTEALNYYDDLIDFFQYYVYTYVVYICIDTNICIAVEIYPELFVMKTRRMISCMLILLSLS